MIDYAGQTILLSAHSAPSDRLWLDERALPSYVAAVSLLILLYRGAATLRIRSHERNTPKPEVFAADANFLIRRGGATIFALKLTRLAGLLAFLALALTTAVQHGKSQPWTDLTQVIVLVYSNLLGILNVLAHARQSLTYSFHISLVMIVVVAVYVYRDIWPLMTFTLQPKDGYEGRLLWVKIALAAFVGVLEPLVEPYPYIPYDLACPRQPSPEQTASLLSYLTYMWLDPVIWLAYRKPHLPLDELPPLCDHDEAHHLIERSFPRLDTFSGAPRRHLFWGLVTVFRRSLAIQSVLLVFSAFAHIAVPIGTKQLLRYLETRGEGATVKPWVWILWFGGAPVVQVILGQYHMFLSTWNLVRAEAIITSLIFDHALRIRLKAETNHVKMEGEASNASGPPKDNAKGSTAPDSSSEIGDNATVHSRNTTNASTSATSTTATVVAASPSKGKEEDGKVTGATTKKGGNLAGKINNLVTSDLDNITSARDFLYLIISAPLRFSFGMIFLYQILGWSAFAGLAVMIVMLPVPTVLSSRLQGVQKQKMKATDARVQSVTEVMGVLRMVKLFGWEPRVKEIISEKRETELNLIWKRRLIELTNNCINHCIPLLHMVVTYTVYTLIMKRNLTASIVFSSITAFEMLRNQLRRVVQMLPDMISANVSLGRIADFLRTTELLDAFAETPSGEAIVDASDLHTDDIGFGRANFSWANEEDTGSVTPSRRTFRLCIDNEVYFRQGAFNLIVGPTGSGKTSVLMALLGEMHYIPLGPDSWMHLPREGGVAYAAQESWVLNDTIKGNILFDAPYNEERYHKVIYQCGLSRDLSLFDAGDATEVGEKGITLSGGQKARVTLARAVYSSAEILLLDDVLAALDVHTARWVVDKCLKGDLVRGRTVLLVTHNVALASSLAEFVVSLQDGRIVGQGSVREALKQDIGLQEAFEHEHEAIELDEGEEAIAGPSGLPSLPSPNAANKKGKLVIAEEIEVGHVSWAAFKLFLRGLGGRFPPLFWMQYLCGEILSEFFGIVELWWLGYWAKQYVSSDPNKVRISFFVDIYCLLVGVTVMTHVYGQIVYTTASLRASRNMHAMLVQSLLSSTFRWLDVTPAARVTTRCTQDMNAIDGPVPRSLDAVIQVAISCAP